MGIFNIQQYLYYTVLMMSSGDESSDPRPVKLCAN